MLEQQFNNPAPGQNRIMLRVGERPLPVEQRRRRRTSSPARSRSAASRSRAGPDYRVVMNNFMADGGDGYTVFRDQCTAAARRRASTSTPSLPYLGKHSPVAPPALNRIEKVG